MMQTDSSTYRVQSFGFVKGDNDIFRKIEDVDK